MTGQRREGKERLQEWENRWQNRKKRDKEEKINRKVNLAEIVFIVTIHHQQTRYEDLLVHDVLQNTNKCIIFLVSYPLVSFCPHANVEIMLSTHFYFTMVFSGVIHIERFKCVWKKNRHENNAGNICAHSMN